MPNVNRHYLDQGGLSQVWQKIDDLFVRNTELRDTLANYESKEELATELAKYYTKTQVDTIIAAVEGKITTEELRAKAAEEALQTNIDAEETRAKAEEAKKVDKEITGTNGKAIIFNEADGGGAKFEHNDGTWSFAGVNDGGSTGMAGQVYAVDSTAGYKGTKLDVWTKGLFYTKGDESLKSQAERAVKANELAVKGDIAEYTIVKDAQPGEYASVYHLTKDGVNVGAAIEIAKDQLLKSVTVKTCTEARVPLPELEVGDKYIDFEFEITSGTTHSYIAVKNMVTPYTAGDGIDISSANVISVSAIGIAKVTGLQDALDAKATQTALQEEISARTTAVSQEATARQQADTTLQGNIDSEVSRATAAEATLNTNKLNKLPNVDDPEDPGYGYPYWIPYSFATTTSTTGLDITLKTLTLDNQLLKRNWTNPFPVANSSQAGIMTAADKTKLDEIDTLTQAEIEAICQ